MESKAGGMVSKELDWLCRSTLQARFPYFRNVEIAASFYPYIGMTHTIRRKGSRWIVRISDHCRRAPRIVLEAIVLMLACKVLRRSPPRQMVEIYERFRQEALIEAEVHARRLQRGRKRIDTREGKHHSLWDIYCDVNTRYFNGQVEIKKIGWGPRRSWGRLGHYDPVHHTVTISPVLDSARVPRSVVGFIVYHELLHTLFEDHVAKGSRHRYHPAEFRRSERAYPNYAAAKKFLNLFCRTRGKLK